MGWRWFLVVFVISLLPFLSSLENGFVYDDIELVCNNAYARNPGDFSGIFGTYVFGNYHPVTILSYAIDYTLGHGHPFVYHLTNILLHATVAVLVLYLLLLLNIENTIAVIAAIVFALHPIHAEAVAWVSGRKDLLAALFSLLSVICWWYYRVRGSKWRYAVSLVFFVMAVLSKPASMVLPLMFLFIDIRLGYSAGRVALSLIFPAVIAVVVAVVAVIGQHGINAVDMLKPQVWARLVFAFWLILYYPFITLYPGGLSVHHAFPVANGIINIPPAMVIVAAASAAICAFVVARWIFSASCRARLKAVCRVEKPDGKFLMLFGVVWYVVFTLPYLQFVSIGNALAAERFVYLSVLGLFVLLALILCRVASMLCASKGISVGVLSVLLGLLLLQSLNRSTLWSNDLNFYKAFTRAEATATFAWQKYAKALDEAGRQQEAEGAYREAVRNGKGKDWRTFHNLALNLDQQGRYAESVICYSNATALNPDAAVSFFRWALATAVLGDDERAMLFLSEAEKLHRGIGRDLYVQAEQFAYSGRKHEALLFYAGAAVVQQSTIESLYRGGCMAAETGNLLVAERLYRRALYLDFYSVAVRNNLAMLLSELGRISEAGALFKESADLFPKEGLLMRNYLLFLDAHGSLQERDATIHRLLAIDPTDEYANMMQKRIRAGK